MWHQTQSFTRDIYGFWKESFIHIGVARNLAILLEEMFPIPGHLFFYKEREAINWGGGHKR